MELRKMESASHPPSFNNQYLLKAAQSGQSVEDFLETVPDQLVAGGPYPADTSARDAASMHAHVRAAAREAQAIYANEAPYGETAPLTVGGVVNALRRSADDLGKSGGPEGKFRVMCTAATGTYTAAIGGLVGLGIGFMLGAPGEGALIGAVSLGVVGIYGGSRAGAAIADDAQKKGQANREIADCLESWNIKS